jgi:protein dpy-30
MAAAANATGTAAMLERAIGADQQTQTKEEDLKAYLGDTLIPLLAYALDELEKIRPPDPVLFLVHFLLRHNPKKSYQ